MKAKTLRIVTYKFHISAGYPNCINYTVYINATDYDEAKKKLGKYLFENDILLTRIIRHSVSRNHHDEGHKLGFK